MSTIEFNNSLVNMAATLQGFARNFTKQTDDVNDLVQDTLTKALMNKNKFREGTNLKAWLFTIMRNIFINNYRRASRTPQSVDPLDYLVSQAKGFNSLPDAELSVKEINRGIESLSQTLRVPFEMYNEGYKYQEIAEELDLPVGTVKSRIFLARKQLTQLLKSYQSN